MVASIIVVHCNIKSPIKRVRKYPMGSYVKVIVKVSASCFQARSGASPLLSPRMLQESERNQEVAVDKLDADFCGKLVACLASPSRFISVSGPPPPSLAAERALAPQDGSDRIGLGLNPCASVVGPSSRSPPGS